MPDTPEVLRHIVDTLPPDTLERVAVIDLIRIVDAVLNVVR